MKTYVAKPHDITREWYHIDAAGMTLGRLAVTVANVLRGKHKPTYSTHLDTGDFVIITNADQVIVTGRKAEQKVYVRHTGYPGGFRSVPYKKMKETHPERIVEKAIRGMLPHNHMGDHQYTKLKVYAGAKHPHEAQMPKALNLTQEGEMTRGS